MRLLRLGAGGTVAQDEAVRMICEKIDTGAAALQAVLQGATPDAVVSTYRRAVQANAERLASS